MKTRNLLLAGLLFVSGTAQLLSQNHTTGATNSMVSITSGTSNTACGTGALQLTTTGMNNAAFGTSALNNNTNGSQNTAIGSGAMSANTTGGYNIGVGNNALAFNTTGSYNYAFGNRCMEYNGNGGLNVAMGFRALGGLSFSGSNNTAIGYTSLISNTTGGWNTGLGMNSGAQVTTGGVNTCVGFESGANLTTGNFNTYIGRVAVANVATSPTTIGNDGSSNVILADGANNQRLIIYGGDVSTNARAGFAGIGLTNNTIPNNRLEVRHGTTGNSGLRLTSMTNLNTTPVTNPDADRGVLSVDSNGDVILVTDQLGTGGGGSGVTNSCTTNNYVTKSASGGASLACSIIYDDGTSVGISSTGSFAYSSPSYVGSMGTITSGTLKLDVNGTMRTVNLYATSDEKFKKNIKPIESALDKVTHLDGKTYNWKKDEYKNYNFSDELQYGLIAQEVQKVMPSLVIKMENDDLALNYIGLIPVLIEAMKEQQTQIDELKNQLSENFKAQNTELIHLGNTKIISVSPNPSNGQIMVSFNIEKSVASAKLLVHDLNGNVLGSLNINERENNITKTLQKDNFGAGIYIVSLVINGKSIDTKKIIFN